VIGLAVVILIESEDEQAVVRLCPLDIAIEVLLKPGVTLLNAAIVHIVEEIWDHEGQGGQRRVIGREGRER
jgi:hypothetical protein